MSIPDRLFRLGKAYLNQVRDRIDTELSEREAASRELAGDPKGASVDATDPDGLMRRAQERIAAARREIDARHELQPAEPAAAGTASKDPNASDYRILGIPVGSDLASVQAAYEKLVARCDPRRFPDDSEEQKTAGEILKRVNEAYDALRRRLDPTENRFGKLELE